MQNIDAASPGTKLASMRRVVTPMCFEKHAFQVLAKAMADLPKYATNSLRRFPSLHDHYKKEDGGEKATNKQDDRGERAVDSKHE